VPDNHPVCFAGGEEIVLRKSDGRNDLGYARGMRAESVRGSAVLHGGGVREQSLKLRDQLLKIVIQPIR